MTRHQMRHLLVPTRQRRLTQPRLTRIQIPVIGPGRSIRPHRHPIHKELNPNHPTIIRRRRLQRRDCGHRRTVGRRGDRDQRRPVHQHGHGVIRSLAAGVGGHRLDEVEAAGGAAPIPGCAERLVAVDSEGDTVGEELDLGDPVVVAGVGGDVHRASRHCAIRRGGDGDRRLGVVVTGRRLCRPQRIHQRLGNAVRVRSSAAERLAHLPLSVAGAGRGVGLFPIGALACGLHHLQDLRRAQAWVLRKHEGDDAGDMRRRHRGP